MQKAFADDAVKDAEEFDTPLSLVSIGGRPLCNLRIADGIERLTGSEELKDWRHGNQLRSDKSKILVNSVKAKTVYIYHHIDERKTLEEVDQFKCIGFPQTKNGTSMKEPLAETWNHRLPPPYNHQSASVKPICHRRIP